MYPRAKTLGLIFNENRILLEEQEGIHSKGKGYFYRPIGGTIEVGEKSVETLIREFKEEIKVEVMIKDYVSCIENIFKIDTNIGHEIIQIYVVEFKDKTLYKKESFEIIEGNKITYAKWVSLAEILEGKKVLYPDGLFELLQDKFQKSYSTNNDFKCNKYL